MTLPTKNRLLRLGLVTSITALLTVVTATPMAPQQTASPGAAPVTSAVSTDSATTPLPGRLRRDWPRAEPSLAGRSSTLRSMPVARDHTIVISTLTLVLIAVIVTILVLR